MASEVILFGEPMALFVAREEGSLSEATQFTRMLAGAEVNVAIGLTRLGYDVTYATRLGMDPFGDYIERKLELEGIHTEIIRDKERPTGFQWKNHVRKGDPATYYLRKNSAASCITEEDVDSIDFTGARLLHITGILPALSLNSRNAVYRIIEKARKEGMIISFDPNLRECLWESRSAMIRTINDLASKADIVLPGIQEGNILMGSKDPEEIAKFYQELGAKIVVVKLGDKGAYARSETEEGYFEGYPIKEVIDTVGAGDGFAVGVLSGVLEGVSLKEMANRGNAIGAMQVMVSSDNEDLPTREELERFQKEGHR
ncbi:MAG: sugar kinase [Firmicutes bacterium]|uniref:Sugar kinase n=1 Tax=Candidatus Scybalomonas excrementavium TaxID=2840943 RepID=A0A9D9N7Q1_9FIRM|nr:sugar kinase [Candidatus Scybalomonas excrementavium]